MMKRKELSVSQIEARKAKMKLAIDRGVFSYDYHKRKKRIEDDMPRQ